MTDAIQGAGGKVYLVGGYLRNIVEGREPGDVDLLVTGKCWPALYMLDLVKRPG